MSKIKTYGEAYTIVKNSLHMKNGIFRTVKLPKHRERMKRKPAIKYYGAKISSFFKNSNVA